MSRTVQSAVRPVRKRAATRGARERPFTVPPVDEVGERIRVRLYPEFPERGVFVDVDLVGSVRHELFDGLRRVRADDDRLHGMVDLRGEFPRLAEEFKPDGMQRAVRSHLRDHRDPAPFRLVHARRGVVDELERAAALAQAQAAHAAAGADLQLPGRVLGNGAEGTQRLGRVPVVNHFLVDLYV